MSERAGRLLRGSVGTVLFIGVLEALVRTGVIAGSALPAPTKVLGEAVSLLVEPDFLAAIAVTLGAWLVGLAIAVAVGVALGALIGGSPRFERLMRVPIELVRPLPAVALAPLLLGVYGRGLWSRALAVAFAAVWPILFNTSYAVGTIDSTRIDTARSFGLTPLQIWLRVRLPALAPFAFTGLRLAAAIGLIVAVSVEFLLPGSGVGGYVAELSTGIGTLATVYGAVVVVGVVGVVLNAALVAADRRLFPWRTA
ncbi:MAG: ABC transporter permease subunit [Acidimicrobiia bacterium]|nr:ABC transporter permease subunit [Acidimicrobiia bacterium]